MQHAHLQDWRNLYSENGLSAKARRSDDLPSQIERSIDRIRALQEDLLISKGKRLLMVLLLRLMFTMLMKSIFLIFLVCIWLGGPGKGNKNQLLQELEKFDPPSMMITSLNQEQRDLQERAKSIKRVINQFEPAVEHFHHRLPTLKTQDKDDTGTELIHLHSDFPMGGRGGRRAYLESVWEEQEKVPSLSEHLIDGSVAQGLLLIACYIGSTCYYSYPSYYPPFPFSRF